MELPRPFSKSTRQYITFIPILISTVIALLIVLLACFVAGMISISDGVIVFLFYGTIVLFLYYIPAITVWDCMHECDDTQKIKSQ